MAKQGLSSAFIRFLRDVVLFDVIILAVVGLICLVVHWDYGTCLLLVGAAVLVIGISRVSGQWRTRSLDYLYGQSVGQDNLPQGSQQTMQETAHAYRFQFRMTLIGIIAVIVGGLIQAASV